MTRGKIGVQARGAKSHLAVKAKVTRDHKNRPYQLFRPACSRVTMRNITWLLPTSGPLTCKKCLALAEQRGIDEFSSLTQADAIGQEEAAKDALEMLCLYCEGDNPRQGTRFCCDACEDLYNEEN